MSKIQWTDATWNPLAGCSVVSSGCANCYAMKQAGSGRLVNTPKYQGLTQPSKAGPVWTGEVRLWPSALDQPQRWKKPKMIFVNSMSDLFHEDVPDGWPNRIFDGMESAPQHTYQVLTKRTHRMADYLSKRWTGAYLPQFIWLGTSIEDQTRAEQRLPHLLRTPAAVRFLSMEPLLQGVDITAFRRTQADGFIRPLDGRFRTVDWVIVGGESGPSARPFDLGWARSIRDQCQAAGVPVFIKQLGSHPIITESRSLTRLHFNDRKGGEWDEWPEDLRVREYPE